VAERHVVERIENGGQILGPKIYVAPAKANAVGDHIENVPEAPDERTARRMKITEKER